MTNRRVIIQFNDDAEGLYRDSVMQLLECLVNSEDVVEYRKLPHYDGYSGLALQDVEVVFHEQCAEDTFDKLVYLIYHAAGVKDVYRPDEPKTEEPPKPTERSVVDIMASPQSTLLVTLKDGLDFSEVFEVAGQLCAASTAIVGVTVDRVVKVERP